MKMPNILPPGSGPESAQNPRSPEGDDEYVQKSPKREGWGGGKGRKPKVFDRIWGPRASPGPGGGTLCYAIVLPGRKSGFRAGFRPDSSRGNLKIGPPAGLRPAGGPILMLSRLESGRNPARKPDFRPGSTIA